MVLVEVEELVRVVAIIRFHIHDIRRIIMNVIGRGIAKCTIVDRLDVRDITILLDIHQVQLPLQQVVHENGMNGTNEFDKLLNIMTIHVHYSVMSLFVLLSILQVIVGDERKEGLLTLLGHGEVLTVNVMKEGVEVLIVLAGNNQFQKSIKRIQRGIGIELVV